ncbi:hypothetical protein [Hymenobacter sublimis]|uniref:Uncharacterized protein n=1 Tax=Hymenobacter sublimis TaxID=2933777 RepID=A0ABY4JBN9_9BACT|nr:hypothetical protein [Hymenobacter sublimis]UPL50025.1 hypothetical protein MWH26_03720 [Hymenobacter sublimis]
MSLLLASCLLPNRLHAQTNRIQVQHLEQELELVKMLPDSLDVNPGPMLVLPSASWGSAQKQLPADKGVIYGSCLQRLDGSRSGGLGQYVRVVNLETRKNFRLNVKPIVRTRRENPFCYALPPGHYALHSYEFSDSKWYGAQAFLESIRKPRNSQTLANTRYVFEVKPGQLHYVGTWDLSQEFDPRFLDEKSTIDADFHKSYPHLPLNDAQTVLPR